MFLLLRLEGAFVAEWCESAGAELGRGWRRTRTRRGHEALRKRGGGGVVGAVAKLTLLRPLLLRVRRWRAALVRSRVDGSRVVVAEGGLGGRRRLRPLLPAKVDRGRLRVERIVLGVEDDAVDLIGRRAVRGGRARVGGRGNTVAVVGWW